MLYSIKESVHTTKCGEVSYEVNLPPLTCVGLGVGEAFIKHAWFSAVAVRILLI